MEDFPIAPLNVSGKVITGLVFLMALSFGVLHLTMEAFPVPALFLLPVTLFITWGFSPRGYLVEPGSLVIQRPFHAKTLPLARDLTAETDPEAGKGATKLAGNGGLFAFTGSFRSKRLGAFTAYATDWTRGVILRTGGKTYVLTPEDPELFVMRLRESVC